MITSTINIDKNIKLRNIFVILLFYCVLVYFASYYLYYNYFMLL